MRGRGHIGAALATLLVGALLVAATAPVGAAAGCPTTTTADDTAVFAGESPVVVSERDGGHLLAPAGTAVEVVEVGSVWVEPLSQPTDARLYRLAPDPDGPFGGGWVFPDDVASSLAFEACLRGLPSPFVGEPTDVAGTAGIASATITWAPPVGTAEVTGYVVSRSGTDSASLPASGRRHTFTLLSLEPHTLTVRAVGALGPGSSVSVQVTPLAEPPPKVLPEVIERSGYWMVGAKGRVHAFGDARHHGDAAVGSRVAVDIEAAPDGRGYWVVDDGGKVTARGSATYHGHITALPPGERVTSLAATRTGAGYWLFTSIGAVIPFGDARHRGDMLGTELQQPVLDSTRTTAGGGYWMVAADGGVFSFGDARFSGSMGGQPLNGPVRSLAPDPDGTGYWLVATDGGIFAFRAPFRGSMGGKPLNRPVVGMVPYGDGYLLVAADGGIFSFSDRRFRGSLGANPPSVPIVAAAALP